jgi:hypothetical protein
MVNFGADEVVVVIYPIIEMTSQAHPTIEEPFFERASTTFLFQISLTPAITTDAAFTCLGYFVEWLVDDGFDVIVWVDSLACTDRHLPS